MTNYSGAALPDPIKITVQKNKFQNATSFPVTFSLGISVDSIDALCQHLQALKADVNKHKSSQFYQTVEKKNMEKHCVYLNGNGKEGDPYPFGSINPKLIDNELEDSF